MNTRDYLKQIGDLLRTGFEEWDRLGHVNVVEHDNLILFNYNNDAVVDGRWGWFEKLSRGLIFNKDTGECVALPFQKFFNWNEQERPTCELREVTEKVDGSLGILYRHKGQYHIATRGSFTGDQALWATEHLRKTIWLDMYGGLPQNVTLLFEIIYPANRIVVDYGNLEQLVLIGARNTKTGQDYWYNEYQLFGDQFAIVTPKTYQMIDLDSILEMSEKLSYNEEGYVLRYADGQRFKVKGSMYLQAHRIMTGTTFNRTLDAYFSGTLEGMLADLPDEFLGSVKLWRDEIVHRQYTIWQQSMALFKTCPKESRKDFALYVTQYHREYAPYLFALLDDKDLNPIIHKQLKEEGSQL